MLQFSLRQLAVSPQIKLAPEDRTNMILRNISAYILTDCFVVERLGCNDQLEEEAKEDAKEETKEEKDNDAEVKADEPAEKEEASPKITQDSAVCCKCSWSLLWILLVLFGLRFHLGLRPKNHIHRVSDGHIGHIKHWTRPRILPFCKALCFVGPPYLQKRYHPFIASAAMFAARRDVISIDSYPHVIWNFSLIC